MSTVIVKIKYYSQEMQDCKGRMFELTKTFTFNKVPVIKSRIILKNDAREYINFIYPDYDPDTDTYCINMESSEDVQRYYQGNLVERMSKVVKRYQDHGWKCTLIDPGERWIH